MTQTQEFYINQTFQTPKQEYKEEIHIDENDKEVKILVPIPLPWENYPPEAAVWCNEYNAFLKDNEDGTFTIAAVPEPDQQELNAQRVAEIDAELAGLDVKTARSLRAIAAGVGTEQDQQSINDIEARVAMLRAERKTLTG